MHDMHICTNTTMAVTYAVTCRYISRFRCRWVHGEASSGISPSRIRAAPEGPPHHLLCPWQQTAGCEWHLRPPCDPSRGHFLPPFWVTSPKVRDVCQLATAYAALASTQQFCDLSISSTSLLLAHWQVCSCDILSAQFRFRTGLACGMAGPLSRITIILSIDCDLSTVAMKISQNPFWP